MLLPPEPMGIDTSPAAPLAPAALMPALSSGWFAWPPSPESLGAKSSLVTRVVMLWAGNEYESGSLTATVAWAVSETSAVVS